MNAVGECDLGDCVSLAVEVSSSSVAPRDSGTHSLSEPPLNTSSVSQVSHRQWLVCLPFRLQWCLGCYFIRTDVCFFWGTEDCEPRDRQWIWEFLLESVSFWTTTSAPRKVQICINSNKEILSVAGTDWEHGSNMRITQVLSFHLQCTVPE